jgi:hypothetical protein
MNYSYATEKSYTYWIKRFISFHEKRHPRSMGEAEIEPFLNHLATVVPRVAARGCFYDWEEYDGRL